MNRTLQIWLKRLGEKETSRMRVMLDTNIIISVAIFQSPILETLLNDITDNHKLILPSYVIDELNEVVVKKFPTKQQLIDNFLLKVPYEIEYTPKSIPDLPGIKIRDKDDKAILYSAITAEVDILITGDKDFCNINIEKPKIMTARAFLDKYQE